MATKAIETGTVKRRIRKVFGDIHEVVQMPNLIEVQRESYEQFLRSDPSIGYVSGLEKTLRSVFPIRDPWATRRWRLTSWWKFFLPAIERARCSPKSAIGSRPARASCG